MKAILCRAFGPPSSLELADLPDPSPGRGEAVIAVRACSLNFFDTLTIQNRYQFKPPMPFSPGAEVAGVIEAVGEGVDRLKVGDRVTAYVRWNGAREKLAASQEDVIVMPDGVSFEVGASLIVTYGTTLHALADRGRLKSGETLAVLGASGGVGQAAIELGKLMGARVIACASSPEKLDFCRSMGADEGIDYATEDLKARLKDLTGGKGVDVVYDAVGGPYAEPALRSTAWEGRFLVIGFAAGEIPRIPLNLVLLKGCDIVGVFWGEAITRDPAGHRRNMERLLNWAAEGKLKPHIDSALPLSETARALERLAAREVKGKVVVVP